MTSPSDLLPCSTGEGGGTTGAGDGERLKPPERCCYQPIRSTDRQTDSGKMMMSSVNFQRIVGCEQEWSCDFYIIDYVTIKINDPNGHRLSPVGHLMIY